MKAFEEMPEVSKAARLAANRLFARQVQSTTSGAASSSSMVVDLDDGHAAVESVTGKRRAEDDGSTYAASTAGHPYAAVTDAHGNAAAAGAESGFPTDGYGLAGRQPQAGYPYSYPQYAYPPYGYPAAAAGYGYPGYEQTAAGGSGTGAMGYGQIAGASGQGSGSNTGNVTVIDRNAARHLDKKMRRELGITEDGEYSAEYASAIGSEVGGSNVKQLSAHQMYGDWQPPVAAPGASSGPQHQGSKSKPVRLPHVALLVGVQLNVVAQTGIFCPSNVCPLRHPVLYLTLPNHHHRRTAGGTSQSVGCLCRRRPNNPRGEPHTQNQAPDPDRCCFSPCSAGVRCRAEAWHGQN